MQNDSSGLGIKKARAVAKKLIQDIGINSAPVSIRVVVDYLKKGHRLEVISWDLKEIDGIQVNDGEVQAIGFNPNRHPHRQRFTIAHEIGHFLLGHTNPNHKQDIDLESKRPDETEANAFAAELLMPRDLIKKEYKAGQTDIKKLAEKFLVSEESMGWQVTNMLHLLH